MKKGFKIFKKNYVLRYQSNKNNRFLTQFLIYLFLHKRRDFYRQRNGKSKSTNTWWRLNRFSFFVVVFWNLTTAKKKKKEIHFPTIVTGKIRTTLTAKCIKIRTYVTYVKPYDNYYAFHKCTQTNQGSQANLIS